MASSNNTSLREELVGVSRDLAEASMVGDIAATVARLGSSIALPAAATRPGTLAFNKHTAGQPVGATRASLVGGATLVANPPSLRFEGFVQGQPMLASVSVLNASNRKQRIRVMLLEPDAHPDFIVEGAPHGPLAPGTSEVFYVRFLPTSPGPQAATVRVVGEAAEPAAGRSGGDDESSGVVRTELFVRLDAQAAPSSLAGLPSRVDLGDVPLMATAVRTVTVNNPSDGELRLAVETMKGCPDIVVLAAGGRQHGEGEHTGRREGSDDGATATDGLPDASPTRLRATVADRLTAAGGGSSIKFHIAPHSSRTLLIHYTPVDFGTATTELLVVSEDALSLRAGSSGEQALTTRWKPHTLRIVGSCRPGHVRRTVETALVPALSASVRDLVARAGAEGTAAGAAAAAAASATMSGAIGPASSSIVSGAQDSAATGPASLLAASTPVASRAGGPGASGYGSTAVPGFSLGGFPSMTSGGYGSGSAEGGEGGAAGQRVPPGSPRRWLAADPGLGVVDRRHRAWVEAREAALLALLESQAAWRRNNLAETMAAGGPMAARDPSASLLLPGSDGGVDFDYVSLASTGVLEAEKSYRRTRDGLVSKDPRDVKGLTKEHLASFKRAVAASPSQMASLEDVEGGKTGGEAGGAVPFTLPDINEGLEVVRGYRVPAVLENIVDANFVLSQTRGRLKPRDIPIVIARTRLAQNEENEKVSRLQRMVAGDGFAGASAGDVPGSGLGGAGGASTVSTVGQFFDEHYDRQRDGRGSGSGFGSSASPPPAGRPVSRSLSSRSSGSDGSPPPQPARKTVVSLARSKRHGKTKAKAVDPQPGVKSTHRKAGATKKRKERERDPGGGSAPGASLAQLLVTELLSSWLFPLLVRVPPPAVEAPDGTAGVRPPPTPLAPAELPALLAAVRATPDHQLLATGTGLDDLCNGLRLGHVLQLQSVLEGMGVGVVDGLGGPGRLGSTSDFGVTTSLTALLGLPEAGSATRTAAAAAGAGEGTQGGGSWFAPGASTSGAAPEALAVAGLANRVSTAVFEAGALPPGADGGAASTQPVTLALPEGGGYTLGGLMAGGAAAEGSLLAEGAEDKRAPPGLHGPALSMAVGALEAPRIHALRARLAGQLLEALASSEARRPLLPFAQYLGHRLPSKKTVDAVRTTRETLRALEEEVRARFLRTLRTTAAVPPVSPATGTALPLPPPPAGAASKGTKGGAAADPADAATAAALAHPVASNPIWRGAFLPVGAPPVPAELLPPLGGTPDAVPALHYDPALAGVAAAAAASGAVAPVDDATAAPPTASESDAASAWTSTQFRLDRVKSAFSTLLVRVRVERRLAALEAVLRASERAGGVGGGVGALLDHLRAQAVKQPEPSWLTAPGPGGSGGPLALGVRFDSGPPGSAGSGRRPSTVGSAARPGSASPVSPSRPGSAATGLGSPDASDVAVHPSAVGIFAKLLTAEAIRPVGAPYTEDPAEVVPDPPTGHATGKGAAATSGGSWAGTPFPVPVSIPTCFVDAAPFDVGAWDAWEQAAAARRPAPPPPAGGYTTGLSLAAADPLGRSTPLPGLGGIGALVGYAPFPLSAASAIVPGGFQPTEAARPLRQVALLEEAQRAGGMAGDAPAPSAVPLAAVDAVLATAVARNAALELPGPLLAALGALVGGGLGANAGGFGGGGSAGVGGGLIPDAPTPALAPAAGPAVGGPLAAAGLLPPFASPAAAAAGAPAGTCGVPTLPPETDAAALFLAPGALTGGGPGVTPFLPGGVGLAAAGQPALAPGLSQAGVTAPASALPSFAAGAVASAAAAVLAQRESDVAAQPVAVPADATVLDVNGSVVTRGQAEASTLGMGRLALRSVGAEAGAGPGLPAGEGAPQPALFSRAAALPRADGGVGVFGPHALAAALCVETEPTPPPGTPAPAKSVADVVADALAQAQREAGNGPLPPRFDSRTYVPVSAAAGGALTPRTEASAHLGLASGAAAGSGLRLLWGPRAEDALSDDTESDADEEADEAAYGAPAADPARNPLLAASLFFPRFMTAGGAAAGAAATGSGVALAAPPAALPVPAPPSLLKAARDAFAAGAASSAAARVGVALSQRQG